MGRRVNIWKDIIYKGIGLSVSQNGSVRHNGILKDKHDCNGYWVIFCRAKSFPIHHLVAKAFCTGYKYKCIPNHIDCNKKNNYYKNLKCGTQAENIQHACNNGLVEKGREMWKGISKKFTYHE